MTTLTLLTSKYGFGFEAAIKPSDSVAAKLPLGSTQSSTGVGVGLSKLAVSPPTIPDVQAPQVTRSPVKVEKPLYQPLRLPNKHLCHLNKLLYNNYKAKHFKISARWSRSC